MREEEYSRNRSIISREDLWELLKQLHPNLSKDSVDWFIYNCQERRIFKRIGRNMYTLAGSQLDKAFYRPEPTLLTETLEGIIEKGGYAFQIWDVSCLEDFLRPTIQVPSIILVEVEKKHMEEAFKALREYKGLSVQLKPDWRYFSKYASDGVAVVLPLPSEIPRYKDSPHGVRLEKILTDLFANKLLYGLLDDNLRVEIMENAFKSYLVDESAMFRYARRRHKEDTIREFLRQKTGVVLLGDV